MKAAFASSQPFRSLVERSIEAWKRVSHRQGMTQAIKKHSQVLRSLDSLDDFLSLGIISTGFSSFASHSCVKKPSRNGIQTA
jgi:hypothetical protein